MVKPLALLFIAAVLRFTLVAFSLLQSSLRIGDRGTVKVVGGVFCDSNGTNPVSFIDWGKVEPGSMNNVTVYVRNERNVAATISLTSENWNPSNASLRVNVNIVLPSATKEISLEILNFRKSIVMLSGVTLIAS